MAAVANENVPPPTESKSARKKKAKAEADAKALAEKSANTSEPATPALVEGDGSLGAEDASENPFFKELHKYAQSPEHV